MPTNLDFFTNKELGLIINLFQELVQATFGDGKDNECSMEKSKKILTYQTLALIHNRPLMMLHLWMFLMYHFATLDFIDLKNIQIPNVKWKKFVWIVTI